MPPNGSVRVLADDVRDVGGRRFGAAAKAFLGLRDGGNYMPYACTAKANLISAHEMAEKLADYFEDIRDLSVEVKKRQNRRNRSER
jgi:hypothetical protein